MESVSVPVRVRGMYLRKVYLGPSFGFESNIESPRLSNAIEKRRSLGGYHQHETPQNKLTTKYYKILILTFYQINC